MNFRGHGNRQQLTARVHSVADVGDHMREIRLRGPSLASFRSSAGAHVVVHVPNETGNVRRVYSIWKHSPREAFLILRVALHGADSPGCRWATSARPGSEVTIERPRSKITVDPSATYHLFVGDETGAVPLSAMHAQIHRSAAGSAPPVFGVFEASAVGSEMPGADGVPCLPWVYRGQASAFASPVLLRAVRELSLPTVGGTAYVAGESATCRLVQRHLIEERGWRPGAVKVQQQWAPGNPGFGAGRDDQAASS